MKPRIWITEIRFSDDTTISFQKNDIIVLVGPNNAGKSASLKEAELILRLNRKIGKVIKDIQFQKEGTQSELIDFLESFSKKRDVGSPIPNLAGFGYSIHPNAAVSCWSDQENGLRDLFPAFAHLLNTEERLVAVNPPANISLASEPPHHPIHFLQRDDEIESQFNNYFLQAFGKNLIVHRNAGNQVPIYIGEKPIPKGGEDRVSIGYIEELEKLDLLHEQGDGMRSFVGVLLNTFISNHSILFVDEPEAFLHPPQARILGKMLAGNLPQDRQLFMATHSIDLLKGLLDTNATNLKIVRIQRDGPVNRVSTLSNTDINDIWNNSLLRHSNILDGLFHSKVIICESDSDCRFFSALTSNNFNEGRTEFSDILFIHCGGKHRVSVAVKALKKLNVDIKVVVDFDVLNDINPLKDIFECLGGNWPEIESDWKIIKHEIGQKRPELFTVEAKQKIDEIFQSTSEATFPKEKVNAIKSVLKKVSPWTEAKSVGKAYIPAGNATQAFERLQHNVRKEGLLILEVGELEGFVRSVGNHGPKWVSDVLQKDIKTDSEFDVAKKFVEQFV